jgi:hypothetical protein
MDHKQSDYDTNYIKLRRCNRHSFSEAVNLKSDLESLQPRQKIASEA